MNTYSKKNPIYWLYFFGKKILPWMGRIFIIAVYVWLNYRMWTAPEMTVWDKLVFTPIPFMICLFALAVTGFGRIFLAVYEYVVSKGILITYIFLVIVYSFLRAL